jgi:hypothetical protein
VSQLKSTATFSVRFRVQRSLPVDLWKAARRVEQTVRDLAPGGITVEPVALLEVGGGERVRRVVEQAGRHLAAQPEPRPSREFDQGVLPPRQGPFLARKRPLLGETGYLTYLESLTGGAAVTPMEAMEMASIHVFVRSWWLYGRDRRRKKAA